jgi:hypothetical protein
MAFFSLGLGGQRRGYRKPPPRDPQRVFQTDDQLREQIVSEGFAIVEMPDGSVHVWSTAAEVEDVREAYPDCPVHILGQLFTVVDNTRPKRRRLHPPEYYQRRKRKGAATSSTQVLKTADLYIP